MWFKKIPGSQCLFVAEQLGQNCVIISCEYQYGYKISDNNININNNNNDDNNSNNNNYYYYK